MKRILPLLALVIGLTSCGQPPGMRLFQAEYRVDTKLLLVAFYDESDSVPEGELWKSLAEAPMANGTVDSGIPPGPSDPFRAILTGEVEVRIVHASRLLSTAKVGDLKLIRDQPGGTLWHLAPGELAKLTAAATF